VVKRDGTSAKGGVVKRDARGATSS
jgi:hypothetical protein